MNTIAYRLRQEGRQENKASQRAATYNVLQLRFGRVPSTVSEQVDNLHDLTIRQQVTVQAAVAEALDEFMAWLAKQDTPTE